jgi:hypothetical protein
MKKFLLLIVVLLLGSSCASANPPYGGVSFGAFYSSLDSYGEWIPISDGVYGWRPVGVAEDWSPYSYGRWVWSDYGWYWSSDEPWAWAVYHYGRWYNDDYYGWVWIPGYDWAPAWVEWRYGGDCVGWAPLGPYAVFSASFGIFYRTTWVTPYNYWCFTDYRYMTSPSVHQYVYRRENNTRYIGRTRGGGSVQYEGGRIISRGPERQYVERRGNIRVARADIVDTDRRQPERRLQVDGRERIEIYRPSVGQSAVQAAERPGRIRDADRSMRLDIKNLDVRAGEQDRVDGRDYNRAQQYRQERQTREYRAEDPVRTAPRPEIERRSVERRREGNAVDRPRQERLRNQVDRTPPPNRGSVSRPAPARPERQVDRPAPPSPRREAAPAPRESGRRRD